MGEMLQQYICALVDPFVLIKIYQWHFPDAATKGINTHPS